MVNIDKIHSFKLFVDLSIAEIEDILKIAEVKEFKEGEIIIREHMEGHELFIIVDGSVKVSKIVPSGESFTFTVLKKGDYFGEISLLTHKTHSATVEAITNTKIIIINNVNFDKFVEKNPSAGFKILKKIIYEISALLGQMNSNFIAMTDYMWS